MIVEVRDNGSILFSNGPQGLRVVPQVQDIEDVLTSLLDAYHTLLLFQRHGPTT